MNESQVRTRKRQIVNVPSEFQLSDKMPNEEQGLRSSRTQHKPCCKPSCASGCGSPRGSRCTPRCPPCCASRCSPCCGASATCMPCCCCCQAPCGMVSYRLRAGPVGPVLPCLEYSGCCPCDCTPPFYFVRNNCGCCCEWGCCGPYY